MSLSNGDHQGGDPADDEELQSKKEQKMERRYLKLMTDNRWMMKLDEMGKNLEVLKLREKQIRDY